MDTSDVSIVTGNVKEKGFHRKRTIAMAAGVCTRPPDVSATEDCVGDARPADRRDDREEAAEFFTELVAKFLHLPDLPCKCTRLGLTLKSNIKYLSY